MLTKSTAKYLIASVATVGLCVAVANGVLAGKPTSSLAPMRDGDMAARGMQSICNYHRCPSLCTTSTGTDFSSCSNNMVTCTGGTVFCGDSGDSIVCQRYIDPKGPLLQCVPSADEDDLEGKCGIKVNKCLCKIEKTCECSTWYDDECDCGVYINNCEESILEGCN